MFGFDFRQGHQSPEERYTEVAHWLQLSPLVEVQKNLRQLRQQIKADAEDEEPQTRIDKQLASATERAVTSWDEQAVLAYANGLLAPLDAGLRLASLDSGDPAITTLVERAKAEEKELGIAGLQQIAAAIEAVYAVETDEATQERIAKGAIATFESAVARKADAEQHEADERGKAANAIFANVWAAAEPLFAEDGPPINNCPVCATRLCHVVEKWVRFCRNPQLQSRRSDDFTPRLQGRCPEVSVRSCGGEMALGVEGVVSCCMH